MGILIAVIFCVGVYVITKDLTKSWRENQRYLDSLRGEQDKPKNVDMDIRRRMSINYWIGRTDNVDNDERG